MCAICNGATYEEVIDDLDNVVRRYGWASLEVVQVLPLPDRRFPLDVPHTRLG